MFELVGTAAAAGSVVPIAAAVNVIVAAVQSGGGAFVALKTAILGINWRRGSEHGWDEFSSLAWSGGLLVGSTALGTAIGGGAGMVPGMVVAGYGPLGDVPGELLGALSYLGAILSPGLYLMRHKLRGVVPALRRDFVRTFVARRG